MSDTDPWLLLRREPEKAFRATTHLQLRALGDGDITRFLAAEAWQVYLSILYALLLFRRRHELAPLHVDLYDYVRPAVEMIPERNPYSPESFAGDMNQLTSWGCVRKDVEASRIRGYKDRSRENFRYTLNRDTVSFLEWLEGRFEDRLHGSAYDGRDLLLDLAARLQETFKLAGKTKGTAVGPEAARRMLHLLQAVDEGIDSITTDLTALRVEMHTYVRGLAAKDDLKKVVGGLEKYVSQYIHRMRDLGLLAYKAARRLARPSCRKVFEAARDIMASERLFRSQGLRDPNEVINAALPFLEPQGHLSESCSRVEQMASDVVRRVHRQLKDLEIRNFRLEELNGRLSQMASLPEDDGRPAAFLSALFAFAHFRNDPFPGVDGGKAKPPAPRKSGGWKPREQPMPLRSKRLKVETVFHAEEERRRALREYVRMVLLGGRGSGLLSEASLRTGDDPLGWLAVAKARYLGGGREMSRAGLKVAARPGVATLSSDGRHVQTADHELEIDAPVAAEAKNA